MQECITLLKIVYNTFLKILENKFGLYYLIIYICRVIKNKDVMNEFKGTKGTWIIDGCHITNGINPFDSTICDFNPECEYPTVFERSKEEAIANAQLIVAAPVMLHELGEMKFYAEQCLKSLDNNSIAEVRGLLEGMINKAVSAINTAVPIPTCVTIEINGDEMERPYQM